MNYKTNETGQQQTVEQIRDLFTQFGHSEYGGEAVTQLQHGLQTAMLAEQEGASAELIAAALLHDIGHLLHELPDDTPDQGIDDVHEVLAANWLRERFPAEVLEPVRLHVAAKRYMCTSVPGYWDALSEPSRLSLELQGGAMSKDECEAFERGQHFDACIRLRRWDDYAKIRDLETPPLSHFLRYVGEVALMPAV